MATILGENVRNEANAFATSVPLASEWEGMPEGPVAEANFTEEWLRQNPHDPVAPFLHLFMAHRLRAGYEAARAQNEEGLWRILAGRYREALGKARSSSNPLLSCIAVDLEKQPHVYLEGQGRP